MLFLGKIICEKKSAPCYCIYNIELYRSIGTQVCNWSLPRSSEKWLGQKFGLFRSNQAPIRMNNLAKAQMEL